MRRDVGQIAKGPESLLSAVLHGSMTAEMEDTVDLVQSKARLPAHLPRYGSIP
jgi:hypothetical protein